MQDPILLICCTLACAALLGALVAVFKPFE
jgi:hypothetical protein